MYTHEGCYCGYALPISSLISRDSSTGRCYSQKLVSADYEVVLVNDSSSDNHLDISITIAEFDQMTNGSLSLEGTLDALDPTSCVGLAFNRQNFYYDADKQVRVSFF